MTDQDRLQSLVQKLQSLTGLQEDTFQHIERLLNEKKPSFGFDETGKLRVCFFDAKPYDVEAFTKANRDRFSLQFLDASLNRQTVSGVENYRAVCIFVNDVCDAEVVDELADRGVELIALRCAGYNNVDMEVCRRRNLNVVRVPAYSPYAVAEHTVALMMMLNRKLHKAYLRNRAGMFVIHGLTGFDMYGKTVGVIGTGKIGQCLVNILLGFGCRVLAFDKFPNAELQANPNVEYVELDRLFRESRVISLHVPLFEETRYLINADAIAKMQVGVMILNTSRGALIDTRALINGLKSGKIGAAGLDVYEEEAGIFFQDMSGKVLSDDVLARLLSFNNVVITSHQAFLTEEALSNIAETTLSNIAEFAAGKFG